MIAGPNGAGKTTFACEYLPLEVSSTAVKNADLIIDNGGCGPELVAEGVQP